MRLDFIKHHLVPEFPVAVCCRVLEVSTSGFYRRRKHPVGKRAARHADLTAEVTRVFDASHRVYGSPRVRNEIVKAGTPINRKTVARIMQENLLRSKVSRKFRVMTTDSRHDHPIAPNLLDRRFRVDGINLVWLADITYIVTVQGFLYLATVMDACSRRIVGWSTADHLRADLPIAALVAALADRKPLPGLLHHSDRGVQYACTAYRGILAEHRHVASMSRRGNCYDNAPQESFFGKFKTEWAPPKPYATREEAKAAVFEYIEIFYNRRRSHSSLGYRSPVSFEEGRS